MDVKNLATVFFAVISLTVSTCYGKDGKESKIHIGVIQSLTGIAAEDGKTVLQSLKMAADDINSQKRVVVELIVEDDNTQPKNTVTAFERLALQRVDAVVGATWDFTTNAILPVAARNKTVVFNTSNLLESLALSQSDGFGFLNAVTAESEAIPFAKYLNNHSVKTVAIVFVNNSWGETQLKAYSAIALKHGVNVLDKIRSVSYDANEWNTLITKLKQKKPDLVLLLLNKSDLEIFLQKASILGLKANFFASVNFFYTLANSSSKNFFNGVCFSYPLEQFQRQSDFRKRYRARYGEEPRIRADSSYDGLFILVKAVQDARLHGTSVKDALQLVKYDGLVGHYEFNEAKSFTAGTSSLACVRDGEARVEK